MILGMKAFKQLNGGIIKGIPLVLRRRPKGISVPKTDGTRVRMQKWLLSIEADPEWVKGKLIEVKTLALPDVDEDLLLPPGEIDEPDYEGPEHEAQELEPGQEPVLSLDQAAQVVNADGKRYIDMESVDLLQLWGDIKKSIESITIRLFCGDTLQRTKIYNRHDAFLINLTIMRLC